MLFKLKQIIPEMKRVAVKKNRTGNNRNERTRKICTLLWKKTSQLLISKNENS